MKLRKLLIRFAVLVVLVAIGLVMMPLGRGHTVYLDNKTIEYNGEEYKAFYRVEVKAASLDKAIKLSARERGAAKCIGQDFHMDLVITDQRDSEPRALSVNVKLPYSMDVPILNLPALLAGLPQEAWLDEFIPAPVMEEPEEVDLGDGLEGDLSMDGDLGLGDDLGMGDDFGLEGDDVTLE